MSKPILLEILEFVVDFIGLLAAMLSCVLLFIVLPLISLIGLWTLIQFSIEMLK